MSDSIFFHNRQAHTSIKVKTSFEGLHQYPMAPKDVDDLQSLHRHIFHVSVRIEVFHDDREVEFFLLKHDVEKALKNLFKGKPRKDGVVVLGAFSCEMLAKEIYKRLDRKYRLITRDTEIVVSEDLNNEGVLYVPSQSPRDT